MVPTRYPTIFDPGDDGPDRFLAGAADWLTSTPMGATFECMGVSAPEKAGSGDPRDTVLGLLEIDQWLQRNTTWDFRYRGDGPRQNAAREALMDQSVQLRITSLAEDLGLRSHLDPPYGERTVHFSLGGARRAPLTRTEWLVRDEHRNLRPDRPRRLVALGSARPLTEMEREPGVTDDYAPGAEDEFDLMVGAARAALGFDPADLLEEDEERLGDDVHARRRWWSWTDGTVIVDVVQAPTRRGRTVNTYEQVRHAAEYLDLGPGDTVVISTSAIYVPYQQTEAARAVKDLGCQVAVVGHPISWNPAGSQLNVRTAENYLQEIRSTIQALLRLVGVPGPHDT